MRSCGAASRTSAPMASSAFPPRRLRLRHPDQIQHLPQQRELLGKTVGFRGSRGLVRRVDRGARGGPPLVQEQPMHQVALPSCHAKRDILRTTPVCSSTWNRKTESSPLRNPLNSATMRSSRDSARDQSSSRDSPSSLNRIFFQPCWGAPVKNITRRPPHRRKRFYEVTNFRTAPMDPADSPAKMTVADRLSVPVRSTPGTSGSRRPEGCTVGGTARTPEGSGGSRAELIYCGRAVSSDGAADTGGERGAAAR